MLSGFLNRYNRIEECLISIKIVLFYRHKGKEYIYIIVIWLNVVFACYLFSDLLMNRKLKGCLLSLRCFIVCLTCNTMHVLLIQLNIADFSKSKEHNCFKGTLKASLQSFLSWSNYRSKKHKNTHLCMFIQTVCENC